MIENLTCFIPLCLDQNGSLCSPMFLNYYFKIKKHVAIAEHFKFSLSTKWKEVNFQNLYCGALQYVHRAWCLLAGIFKGKTLCSQGSFIFQFPKALMFSRFSGPYMKFLRNSPMPQVPTFSKWHINFQGSLIIMILSFDVPMIQGSYSARSLHSQTNFFQKQQ